MSTDDQHLRASERFDQTGGAAPENPAELDAWGDFALIAEHLEKADVIALPDGFPQEVRRRIQQAQRRSDLLLVLQTGCVTGLILTRVAATALGFDWWQQLLGALQAGALTGYWTALLGILPAVDLDPQAIYLLAEPFLRVLPGAFLVATIAALLLELAIFRLLRIGPFRLKANNPHTPDDLIL